MRFIKLTLPLILAFAFGMLGVAVQYAAHPLAADVKGTVALWIRIVGGVAILLGVYNLLRLHVMKVARREAGWGYSGFFFLGFLVVVGTVVYNGGQWFWRPFVPAGAFSQLYTHLFEPAGATMFALLGFFIVSAAARSFRARSFEATLLLGAAIIVMLGRAPLGELITGYFPGATEWIMAVPNTAAKRGVLLGVCLGTIGMSLRIMFGVERSWLGGQS